MMVHSEDTIREPRSYHVETGDDDAPVGPSESTLRSHPTIDLLPDHEEGFTQATELTRDNIGDQHLLPKALTQEETIELVRRTVEIGFQETQRSLAGNEAVSDVVKPKLTIDLGYSNIVRIPEAVVDIIKDEVERLSLSNNRIFHIPYRFSECCHLRYLNIRANNFREFPRGVYKLPLLEILDISRNKITKLPDEINRLSSLRVLSVVQNRLDDLPLGISDMNKLQILKVAGNPLRRPLRRVLEAVEAEMTPSVADKEKEIAATAELKRFLKTQQPIPPLDIDAGSDPGDIVLDTPRPVKRGLNSRFPVIPSIGDGSSDSRSFSLYRPPPIPVRSHYRIASGQGVPFHRPGFNSSGVNERIRSNSEGIIQASIAARNKRMGAMNRKNTDLNTLNEFRPYRNSHLRGLSHGSVLRPRPSGLSNPSGPSSPMERRRLRDGFVNRMSSLPEHRGEREVREPIIEGAKGILFALFQIQFHVSMLINVIKQDDSRRNSLELVFYNASTHVDRLNEALENAGNATSDDGDAARLSREVVKQECQTCVMAYMHVGTQLRNALEKIVAHGDSRYIRSLMLMMYGSAVELRNACTSLGIALTGDKRHSIQKPHKRQINQEAFGTDRIPEQISPSRELPTQSRRQRSETVIRHPPPQASGPPTSSQEASPSLTPPSFGQDGRSRSNSRSVPAYTPAVSSPLATPHSQFFLPTPNSVVSRINPLTGLEEIEEERIFEKIFYQLTQAYNAALQALPMARRQFARCLEMSEQSRESEGVQLLWNNLIRRCRICLELSEALGHRISNMKVKEPGGGMRNQREFWQLCKAFMQSFVDLATDMRDVKNMHILPSEIIVVLRPVQRACREAGRLIEASPWSYVADMVTSTQPPANIYGPPLSAQHLHHYPSVSTSTFASHGGSFSPASGMSLPATPLSAALGPAAQATVPSTPASAYSDKFFEGDVFQRAESLLSMPHQAPFFARR